MGLSGLYSGSFGLGFREYAGEVIRMDYMRPKGLSDPELVVDVESGDVLGYVWYEVLDVSMGAMSDVLYVDMIEMRVKGKRLGDRVVASLFERYDVDVIAGVVEVDHWNSSFKFWTRIGAVVVDETGYALEYRDLRDYGTGTQFEFGLSRVDFMRAREAVKENEKISS